MPVEQIPWPKKGDRLFRPATGGRDRNVCLDFHRWWGFESLYANGFKAAADLVVQGYDSAKTPPYRDELFFPVAYLYRHYLELKMKELLRYGTELHRIVVDHEITEGHNLYKLWNATRNLLQDRWPGADPSPLKAMETVINEFHQADKSGQEFRYPTNLAGHPHLQNVPDHVSLSNLKATMDCIYHFLDCCSMDLSESLDALRSNTDRH